LLRRVLAISLCAIRVLLRRSRACVATVTIAEPTYTGIGRMDTAPGGTRKTRGTCERVLAAGGMQRIARVVRAGLED
jgi:hypothetical protein